MKAEGRCGCSHRRQVHADGRGECATPGCGCTRYRRIAPALTPPTPVVVAGTVERAPEAEGEGTAYAAALRRADGNLRNCDDAALMASLLEGDAQIILGAVSPRLVWEGAQARGLTTQQLADLMTSKPDEAINLMWETQ